MKRNLLLLFALICVLFIGLGFYNAETIYELDSDSYTIEGELISRMYYGAPGYGEDPDNDEKEYPYIIKLSEPIKVNTPINGEISVATEINELQVVPLKKEQFEFLEDHMNQLIKVQGQLFQAHTGHHRTEVLIQVDELLD